VPWRVRLRNKLREKTLPLLHAIGPEVFLANVVLLSLKMRDALARILLEQADTSSTKLWV
jgi:hypothetical protein